MYMNKKYVPKSLSAKDKAKQRASIKKGTLRPKVKAPYKRSSHVAAFEKKYGFKITDPRVTQIISRTGINKILAKGKGAYFSAGSLPNTTPTQWARARLASVIMGGKARQVDKAIWEQYKK